MDKYEVTVNLSENREGMKLMLNVWQQLRVTVCTLSIYLLILLGTTTHLQATAHACNGALHRLSNLGPSPHCPGRPLPGQQATNAAGGHDAIPSQRAAAAASAGLGVNKPAAAMQPAAHRRQQRVRETTCRGRGAEVEVEVRQVERGRDAIRCLSDEDDAAHSAVVRGSASKSGSAGGADALESSGVASDSSGGGRGSGPSCGMRPGRAASELLGARQAGAQPNHTARAPAAAAGAAAAAAACTTCTAAAPGTSGRGSGERPAADAPCTHRLGALKGAPAGGSQGWDVAGTSSSAASAAGHAAAGGENARRLDAGSRAAGDLDFNRQAKKRKILTQYEELESCYLSMCAPGRGRGACSNGADLRQMAAQLDDSQGADWCAGKLSLYCVRLNFFSLFCCC